MPSRTLSAMGLSSSPIPKLKNMFKQDSSSPRRTASTNSPKSLIEALPSFVIYEIGRQAESLCDVLNLSLASSRMRSLIAPFLYSNIELKTNKQCKATLVFLSKRPEIAQHIRRLAVHPNPLEWTPLGEEIDEGLVANLITRICPSLRSLESFAWEGWEMPSDELWISLRKSCSRLKGISSTIGVQPLNPSSELFNFSDLKQFSLTVKSRSLEWLKGGQPKPERLPRRLWEMLIERCPRMEELSLSAPAPAHRLFDVRNVVLGRWPRLKSITLGDMILQSGTRDDGTAMADYQTFMKFFTTHTRLRHVAFQQSVGASTFPSAFSVPFSALSNLESFHGPLKYLRSIPHPEKLRFLTLTSLHHTTSSFSPTFTALQDFQNLESLSVWVDLSFGGQLNLQDESQLFNTFLLACPTLRHFQLMCFTRPNFRMKEFSRALRNAPNLESFTITKMYKSSDDEMVASAIRIIQENPNIQEFTLQYTQDRWPTLSGGGRLRQLGIFRTEYDEFGNPVAVHGMERRAKTLGYESSRRYVQSLASKPSSPWDSRSPRSSVSSDARSFTSTSFSTKSWRRRSGSQSSFIVL
ncbi:hypothetical protein DFP72DRAFT_1172030 [Ephemerocybe angulata]|uniref:Uncharacterized protein n=1 Tax=Ephemerocybe angulata TaxID=980116 RepID=A0A8H6M396_9AGAR|nr:hypothetical protein DFP72DRAFT_1172030 [Tulosesus angulatus]